MSQPVTGDTLCYANSELIPRQLTLPSLEHSGIKAERVATAFVHREVVVQWTTRDKGVPSVQYGTASGTYTTTTTGTSATYLRTDMVGQPATTFGYFDPVRSNSPSHGPALAVTFDHGPQARLTT